MTAFELLYLFQETMKRLSECDIRTDDYKYIPMYLKFKDMLKRKEKKEYIKTSLANEYDMSESSVIRVIRRFDKSVNL